MFKALRQQFVHAKFRGRDFTGCGFFTYFDVPDEYRIDNLHGHIDDVHALFERPEEILCFVLWIENGKIDCLEGFQGSGLDWNNDYTGAKIDYMVKERRYYLDY